MNIDITVDDGKYRFTQDNAGQVVVYRHGEEWLSGSFPGINMVIAMACELEEAREQISKLEADVVTLMRDEKS